MKKFIIDENEKSRILKIHGFIKEQVQDDLSKNQMNDIDKLKLALKTCIKNYTWFTPDPEFPLRKTKSGKDVIVGKGKSGDVFYFYADLTVTNATTGAKRNWVCDFKPLPVAPTPEKPIVLNSDQEDVLKRISQDRWTVSPKPSQVALDKGEFESSDLTDPESKLGTTYSKYFPKEQFPKGYLVYRKVITTPQAPSKAQEVVVDGTSCKESIEALYNHMNKPNRFPLSKAEKDGHVRIAQVCAEKKNLLRFGMNNQLKDIASTYGIKIQ